MNKILKHVPGKSKPVAPTPQTQKASPKQVKNSAGGFVFKSDDWARLDRFLIVGTDGTYYISEKAVTISATKAASACLKQDGIRFVSRVVDVSSRRLAPKNQYAVYALAMAAASKDVEVRRYALANLSKVVRTGTELFSFCAYIKSMRGFGRAVRKAIGDWYNQKNPSQLSYQLAKYRQRDGWTHHDVLHLAHPRPASPAHDSAFAWVKGTDKLVHNELEFIVHQETLASMPTPAKSAAYIKQYSNISWEMVKTEHLASPEVWKALLPNMPMTALMRNLGRMTANGAIAPMSAEERHIVSVLRDKQKVIKAGLHPLNTLLALRTYSQGKGEKGSLTWTPNQKIVAALDEAVEHGFHAVEPTGKRILYALDVSGSMGSKCLINNMLCPSEVTGILSKILVTVEKNSMVVGFVGGDPYSFSGRFGKGNVDGIRQLNIHSRMSVQQAVKEVLQSTFGSTDCAAPMLWAMQQNLAFDAFVVMTDNETYAGHVHPHVALQQYRDKMGIPAKMIVLAMAGNQFTIADPNDPGMLDIAGFSTDVVQVMSSFITG